MIVKLVNYTDYLGRSGIKNPTWFCMAVDFLTCTPHFEKLTKDAVVVFVYIAGECVKAKSPELDISLRHASLYCMMSEEEVIQAIEVLRNVRVVLTPCTRHAQNLCTEEERRGEKGNMQAQGPQQVLPLSDPEDIEVGMALVYDRDHESVAVKPKPEELPRLAQIWNTHAHQSLPRVKLCGTSRRRHATNRWKEHPSEEFWVDVIARINRSDFCLGKTKSDRPWRADFDWLVRPDTAAKVVEGKYENRGPGGSPNPPQKSYWARTLTEGGSDADPK